MLEVHFCVFPLLDQLLDLPSCEPESDYLLHFHDQAGYLSLPLLLHLDFNLLLSEVSLDSQLLLLLDFALLHDDLELAQVSDPATQIGLSLRLQFLRFDNFWAVLKTRRFHCLALIFRQRSWLVQQLFYDISYWVW